MKSTIEHREPIIVGFFIIQYAKLRMLELYYNFFDELCDVNKFEELEMDSDSLHLALAEENLYDCIEPEKRAAWEKMTAETLSRRMQNRISSLERVAVRIKSMVSGSRDFLKKNSYVQKCYVCVARHIAAMTTSPISSNLALKD